jgi:hypothetical protein
LSVAVSLKKRRNGAAVDSEKVASEGKRNSPFNAVRLGGGNIPFA